MEGEISVLQVEKRIRTRVKRQMEKTQREYYLNEQMKAIQKELGDEEGRDELAELEEQDQEDQALQGSAREGAARAEEAAPDEPDVGRSDGRPQLSRLAAGIPWGKKRKVKKDLKFAEEVLDDDHYGLEKVKERIVEYLAVQQRANKLKGPILCLVGPPGVGKTSLGKSIAKATGREFVRMSLGGVRDEAEIRGHRRTYIGSMPGKVIQSMRKAKIATRCSCSTRSTRWAWISAAIRPRRCSRCSIPSRTRPFNDHYLEVDYDLSNVMFVTTANTLNIPPPLMDRMEIIRIAGYTEDEKLEIAAAHLIPQAIEGARPRPRRNGRSTTTRCSTMIRRYTREAGVRNLERELSTLIRKAVKELDDRRRRSRCKVTDEDPARVSRRAEIPLRRGRGARTRSASSPAWPGPRSAASC